MRLAQMGLPLLAALSLTGPVAAQAGGNTGAGAGDLAQERSVVLAVRGDALPIEQLRSSLAEELGQAVTLETDALAAPTRGIVTVHYRRAAGELAVTWDSGGRTVSRVIAAAPAVDEVIVDSVLLAGNLAREQVDTLLAPAPQPVSPPVPPVRPAPALSPKWELLSDRTPTKPFAPPRRVVTASLFYPFATHHGAPDTTSYLDFNLLYGRVGALEALGLGVVNVVTRERDPYVNGLQLGVLANVSTGELRGVQVASVLNVTGAPAYGLQAAGGANLSGSSLQGLQASFVLNRARSVVGAQIGAVNLAGDVDGFQLGIVNVAGRVRGTSVGLVNVADDIEGVPLAPISVTRTGGVHPVVWSGSAGYGNAGVKFATRQTYTLFFGSAHRDFGRQFFGGGLAIGGRVPLGSGFHADIDAGGTWLAAPSVSQDGASGDQYHEQLVQPRLRMLLAFRAAKHFGLFLGGAAMATIRSERDWDRVSAAVGPELIGGVEL